MAFLTPAAATTAAAVPLLPTHFLPSRLASCARPHRLSTTTASASLRLPTTVFRASSLATTATSLPHSSAHAGRRAVSAVCRRGAVEFAGKVLPGSTRSFSRSARASRMRMGQKYSPAVQGLEARGIEVYEGMKFRDPTKDNNVGPDGELKWGTFDHREWHDPSRLVRRDISDIQDMDTRRRARLNLARLHSPFYQNMGGKFEDLEGVEDHRDEPNRGQWNAWKTVWAERKYLKKSLYELPKLKEFRKPFLLPTKQQILRFTTHYDPADRSSERARTVKLEVVIKLLGLNKTQLHKFLHLIGEYYNPQAQTFCMETCRYADVAQNKKWLSDVMDDLMKETLDPTDDFHDIPLNPKLVRMKYEPPKPEFPEAWKRPLPKVTNEERKQARAIWLEHCKENMSALSPVEIGSSKLLKVDDELGI